MKTVLNSVNTEIRAVRSQLVDKGLVYFAIALPFAMSFSFSRIFEHGWNLAYYLQIFGTVLIIAGAVFRKRLPYGFRSCLFLGFCLVLGIVGLSSFGLVGGAVIALFVFAVLTAIIFGTVAGLIACSIDLLVVIVTGWAVWSGHITFPFDVNVYATSMTGWGLIIAVLFLTLPPVIIALGAVHEHLVVSLCDLRLKQSQHERLANNLIDTFLYRHDGEGVFNYVSSSVTQVLGFSVEEWMVHYSEYLTNNPVNSELMKHTEQSMAGIQQPPFEAQSLHKDGSVRWLRVFESPVYDENGKVVAVEGVAHDITEIKQATIELYRSQQLIEAQFMNSPATILIIDRDYKILRVNNVNLGLSTGKDLTGKDSVNLLPEEARDLVREAIDRCFDSCQLQEIEHKRRGGMWANAQIAPILEGGKATKALIISSDITRRKQAEQGRERLLKALEFKNKELQDIVYTASHDLKSPLVNIQGFGGELLEDCQRLGKLLEDQDLEDETGMIDLLLKESIPESLGFISKSTTKIKTLLDGLLAISRIGITEVESLPLDMNEIIGEVLVNMEYQIKESGVSVTVESLPGCMGDRRMLYNVLDNLASNAVKYLDLSRPGEISISGKVEGNMSVYCVSDNGIGVAYGHQPMVFEIFHRLNPNDSAGGEGLGLTIVTRILDRLGGEIRLESEPGVGSKFFVSLPTAKL
jgi:PAS domain S-box-containing protein